MKQTKLALSAVMIVAVGLFGANFVSGSDMTSENEIDAFVASSPVYGHVTIVHKDPSGNILSYQQTDNIVTIEGKDCAIERLFGTSGAGDCKAGSINDLFNLVGLVTGTEDPTINSNATQANGFVARDYSDSGLAPNTADSVTTTGATSSVGAKMDILETFTATDDGNNVDMSVLYNAGEDALFAAKKFSAVVLNNGDTLTVTWTITLG